MRYVLDKMKINIIREVLSDVSAKFVSVEEYIRKKLEETYLGEKISVQEIICFMFNLFYCNLF